MASLSSKVDGITGWFDKVGITLEPSVEIRQIPDDADAIAVFAVRDVIENETIACIPKGSVLSIVNTAAADILAASDVRGGLALNFAVLYEQFVMGEKSRWHGYLRSLPKRAYLPIFWSAGETALLQGAEDVDRAVSDLSHIQEDFAVMEALLDANPEVPRRGFTLTNYMAAASWVASRGFGVDDVHEAEAPGSGDGEEATSGSDSQQEDEEPSEDEDEEAEQQRWRPRVSRAGADDDPRWRLEIAICSSMRGDKEVLEIMAVSDVAAGAEVHNTYGELANAELLHKYGFALPDGNPLDRVSLVFDGLAAAARRHLGKPAADKRVALLETESELLSEEEQHLCVAPDAILEAGLVAALYVLFADKADMAAHADMEAVARHLAGQIRDPAPAAVPIGGAQQGGAAEAAAERGGGAAAPAAADSAAAGGAAGKAEEGGSGEEDAEDGSDDEPLLPSVAVADAAAILPPAALAALAEALRQRLDRYRHGASIAEDEAALAAASKGPAGEAKCAKLAALTLVIAEKRILLDALKALKIAAPAAEDQNDKRAPEPAAGRNSKRSKRT